MPDAAVIQKENDDMTQPFKEKPPRVELRGRSGLLAKAVLRRLAT
jgi:hypothetical protein